MLCMISLWEEFKVRQNERGKISDIYKAYDEICEYIQGSPVVYRARALALIAMRYVFLA